MSKKIRPKSVDLKHKAQRAVLPAVVAALMSSAMVAPAHALSYETDNGVAIDWDTVLTYGAAWRVESQDDELLANVNADDGNRNFDKGLITNSFSALTEVGVSYQNLGALVRASGFYDSVYFSSNDNDSPATFNGSGANDRFTKETKDHNGKGARLLDAFVFGNFDLAERNLNVRVGRQVVSWGESLFLPGISTAQSPFDGTKANVPGVEVKDVLLPVGQVFAQLDVTDNLSASAFSQWEWAKTEFDAAGSYFSTSDMLDEGGEAFILFPGFSATRTPNQDASDSGQWGVAFNYFAEELHSTEFGLYYINYHDKLPQLVFDDFIPLGPTFVPTTYHLEYFEDVKLSGLSFATVVGETNVSGEISLRQDAPVLNPLGMAVPANTWQAQVSAIHLFGSTIFADDISFAGEIGYNQVNGMDDDELLYDKSGWGLSGQLTFKYMGVVPGGDLEVPVSFSYNGDGNAAAGTFGRTSVADRISVGAKLIYEIDWQAEVKYTAYLGDAEDNAKADRDFVSFNLKYSF